MERIIVDNVSKQFSIGFKRNLNAISRFISFFSGREPKKTFWVLKNVSFSAKAGEIVGLIGRNGSGKSTLLRVIAGVYNTDEGTVKTNGKLISLINLNIGMQQRLSMKENIFLCCALLGVRIKDIKKRFNSIVKFSELEDFVDTKLYQFSSGMAQRLAFSIAVHCDPEILLVDEVFEVGDEKFKDKGVNKIKELLKGGATVVLTSHRMGMVERYCDRAILLDNGKIIEMGNKKKVIKAYLKNIKK